MKIPVHFYSSNEAHFWASNLINLADHKPVLSLNDLLAALMIDADELYGSTSNDISCRIGWVMFSYSDVCVRRTRIYGEEASYYLEVIDPVYLPRCDHMFTMRWKDEHKRIFNSK